MATDLERIAHGRVGHQLPVIARYNRKLFWPPPAATQQTCWGTPPRASIFPGTFLEKLRRFKRTIEKLGLLTDLRAREFYEKPTAERKRKKAAAVKRHYKRVRSMQLPKKLY